MAAERNLAKRAGREIAEVATAQGGFVSLDQLRDAGVSSRSTSRRAAAGNLHRIHRSVYAVGHRSVGQSALLKAALLACGDDAVISHGTAASLLGLWDEWPASIDVTTPRQAGRKVDGIRCHRCRYPAPEEIQIVQGVACTTVARVLVDLSSQVGLPTLQRTVGRAAMLKILDLQAVALAIHNAKGRWGLRSLAIATAPWETKDGSIPDVRSDFEVLALPKLLDLGLPRPQCNSWLHVDGERFLVDFLWDQPRVVVETDGRETHETPTAFQSDRRRDQFLAGAGYRVLRVTWNQMQNELDEVVERVHRALRSAS